MNPNTTSLSSNELKRLRTRRTYVFKYTPRPSPRLPAYCLKAKWYTATLFLSFFAISATHAVLTQTLNELRVIEAPISKEDLTRITVKEDRIHSVFGITGDYILETDEEQGQIFIRPSNQKPFSLTITTEGGRTQDLHLIPKVQAAEALVLKSAEDIQKEILKEKIPSLGEVETLLEACQRGRIPLGYKLAPLPLQSLQGPYKLIRELKGDTLRCLTYEVSNPLQNVPSSDKKHTLRLSEASFAQSLPLKPDIIAILMPRHILQLGEQTHVYVVVRAH